MNGGTRQFAVVASALGGDVREAARRARQAGFAGVELDVYSPALDLTSLSQSGRRELLRLFATEQQQLVALRCDLGANGFHPGADIDRELARLDRALETVAALGARCLCTDLGPLPAPPAQPAKPQRAISAQQAGLIILPPPRTATPTVAEPAAPPPPDLAFVAQIGAALSELCSRADRYRATVALRSSLASFASLVRSIADVNCPWFGFDVDSVAILRDEWDVDEVFSALGEHVRHVRARDAARGADRRTRPAVIGQGSVDWPRFFGALDEAAYSGMITIDPTDLPDRPAAALEGRTHLHAIAR